MTRGFVPQGSRIAFCFYLLTQQGVCGMITQITIEGIVTPEPWSCLPHN